MNYEPIETKEERLIAAEEIEKLIELDAYRKYTAAVEKFAKVHKGSETRFDDYDKFIRSEKARLSASFGRGAKAAKHVIRLHYIYLLSQDSELKATLSQRSVEQILTKFTGGCVQKTVWSGWFVGRQSQDKSPYITDPEYRVFVHKHKLIQDLMDELGEVLEILDRAKLNRRNPYQTKIDKAMALLFER
jgi:hypothetical protein